MALGRKGWENTASTGDLALKCLPPFKKINLPNWQERFIFNVFILHDQQQLFHTGPFCSINYNIFRNPWKKGLFYYQYPLYLSLYSCSNYVQFAVARGDIFLSVEMQQAKLQLQHHFHHPINKQINLTQIFNFLSKLYETVISSLSDSESSDCLLDSDGEDAVWWWWWWRCVSSLSSSAWPPCAVRSAPWQ